MSETRNLQKFGIEQLVRRLEDPRFLTGAAAPPALINAILDALAPLGVNDIDMPAMPERIWRAIREAI